MKEINPPILSNYTTRKQITVDNYLAHEVTMQKQAILFITSILLSVSAYSQSARALDGHDVMNSYVDEHVAGKRSDKVDLQCYFEDRIPLRFEGTYNTTSKYVDDGSGTAAIATTDKDNPLPHNVIFKRRRSFSNSDSKLYIYVKGDTGSTVYQVDKMTFRVLVMHQQNPITDPLPFTVMYAGTCWGVF